MARMKVCLFVALSGLVALNAGRIRPAKAAIDQWETTIQLFEEWDSKNSFPADAVLFVGSSSIRMWATRACFPELSVINRGFGGSQISDVNFFVRQIVLPYKPAVIVFYAGDNDIAGGKSPQRVLEDYRRFVSLVRKELPKMRIIFISVKPSLSRWSSWPAMSQANQLVKDFSAGDGLLYFVDAATCLLGSDGRPSPELFLDDNLHLSKKGYQLWTSILRPVIYEALKSANGESADNGRP